MYEPQHEMSNEILQAPILCGRNGLKVVVVASTFNKKYTDALVENCRGELDRVAPGVAVTVVRVPGAFEIPMVVNRELQREGKPDAIIALGVIIRGSTAHADLIGEAVTRELLRASCDHLTPVIHEVLLLENEEQAEERFALLAGWIQKGRETYADFYERTLCPARHDRPGAASGGRLRSPAGNGQTAGNFRKTYGMPL